MTKEQFFGVIRHTMTALGGILIAKGLIAEGAWIELSGAIITLTGVIWSVASKKQA